MTVHKFLEPQLTIHEALAWVQFRTLEAVLAAKTPEGLAAYRLYQNDTVKGSMIDLRRELREGTICARGQTKEGAWTEIETHEWLSLPVAPTNIERQLPYRRIILDRDPLLKLFPGKTMEKRRGARPKYDWDWLKLEAAKEDPAINQNSRAEILFSAYEEKTGDKIGMSTIKRRLKEWGYR